MLANSTGPSGRQMVLGGIVAFATAIIIFVARWQTPTPAIVAVVAVGVVAGFTLLISGGLALAARPVWLDATVRDMRWTISGVRRVRAVLLDVGEREPLTVTLDGGVAEMLHIGDRVRIEHNHLNRTQVYRVEVIEPAARE